MQALSRICARIGGAAICPAFLIEYSTESRLGCCGGAISVGEHMAQQALAWRVRQSASVKITFPRVLLEDLAYSDRPAAWSAKQLLAVMQPGSDEIELTPAIIDHVIITLTTVVVAMAMQGGQTSSSGKLHK